MGVKYGSTQSQAMYSKETAWGTAVEAASYFGRLKGYGFSYTDEKINSYDLGERDAKVHLFGPFGVKGNVDFYLVGDSAAAEASAIFEFILGSKTGDGKASTPYTYPSDLAAITYAVGIKDIPSMSIELGKDDGSTANTDTNWTITGAKCGSATISIAKGGLIEVTTNYVAQKVIIDSTIVTYVPPTTLIPFNSAVTAFKYGATSVGTVENASISIDNGLIEGRGLNDRLIQTLLGGQQKITWECTVVMDTDLLGTMYETAFGTETIANGPLNDHLTTGVDAGATMSITCTNGATPAVAYTFVLTNAVINEHSDSIDSGNNLCIVKFSGVAKTLIIEHINQAD